MQYKGSFSKMKSNLRRILDVCYSCLYPILWSLAIITLSGELGSFENTQAFVWWLVSWFTTPSPAELARLNLYLRRIGHMISYGLLYFLWFSAFHRDMALNRKIACLYSLGLCLVLAVLDEGCQSFCPSRGASLWDVSLDLSGAGLAAVITLAVLNPGPDSPEQPSSRTKFL